jgi:hypothetical protein
MAVRVDKSRTKSAVDEHPFVHLQATTEERARILAGASPFDAEVWRQGAVPPTPEELADLEEFLREREEMRQQSLARERGGA